METLTNEITINREWLSEVSEPIIEVLGALKIIGHLLDDGLELDPIESARLGCVFTVIAGYLDSACAEFETIN